MKLTSLCSLAVAAGAASALGVGLALAAPELSRQGDRYVLRGAPLEMSWDAHTGSMVRVVHTRTGLALFEGAERPFDLHTEEGWVFRGEGTRRAVSFGALLLDGEWDFHTEGGPQRKIKVPGAWEDQGVDLPGPKDPDPAWGPYNGDAYYSCSFDLPEALRDKDLLLAIQRVDDFDWVTINGRQVGHTGDEVEDWWAVPRRYPVPAAALKPTGNVIEVRVYDRGGEGGIIGSVMLMTPEQEEALKQAPLRLTSARLENRGNLAQVTLSYEAMGWKAVEVYDVAATGPGFFSRRLELTAEAGAGTPRFDSVEVYVGRVSERLLRSGSIAAPYYWPPLNMPLAEFARDRQVNQHCGQMVTGIGLYSPKPSLAFAVGQYWERDWNRFLCRGKNSIVEVQAQYDCVGRLKPGLKIPAGGQFLLVSDMPGHRAALRAIGQGWERLGFTRVPPPKWAESIALYSCFPGGTMGSHLRDLRSPGDQPSALRNFQKLQLPALKRLGVNAVWFLPLWPRLYGVSDYWSLEPSLGTVDDLRAVVRDAHDGGLRVLCDLIPHGPHESSGLLQEHPEWVSRHEDGTVLYWWGCLSCDYANPGWQDYMARVATYWVREADIDGWRVDCAAGGPENWRPCGDNLPSWSGQWGGLECMRVVREAMSKVKPDHVMLGECANPPMLSQAHFIYDWPAETAMFRVLEEPREDWVRNMAGWLDFQRLALPSGAAHGLMRFTENHDQMHSLWQLGANLARPVWSLMTLAQGFPLLYHEQEVGFEDFWARILGTRQALPELHRGEADYTAVACNQPQVMAFVRQDGPRASLVAINFGRETTACKLSWAEASASLGQAREFPTGAWLKPVRAGKALTVAVTVPGGDWRVVALRADRAELANLPIVEGFELTATEGRAAGGREAETQAVTPDPLCWEDLRATLLLRADGRERIEHLGPGAKESLDQTSGALVGVTVEAAGGWRLQWSGGLLAGIAKGDVPLLDGMWICEGKHQVSWDKPLALGARLSQSLEEPSQQGAAGPATGASAPPATRWRVAPASQGLRIETETPGDEFTLTTRYLVRPDATVDATVILTPARESEPVLGELYLAIGASRAARWRVCGLEGDVGGPFIVRHPTDEEIPGRFWHPIQRLWEHSVQPLSLERSALGWQAGGQWLWLEMAEYPSGRMLDDMYLREYSPDGRAGLTTYLAWMAGRSGHKLDPQEPLAMRFRLKLAAEPEGHAVKLPVRFWADGANWYVENDHYRVCLSRADGGRLRWLFASGKADSIISATDTYTDKGLLGQYTDPLGRQTPAKGTIHGDLEPDCWIEPDTEELTIRFQGYMRMAQMFRTLTSPRIQHETVWHFTGGPRISVQHRVRVMIPPRGKNTGFLAQTLRVPDVTGWEMRVGDRVYTGSPQEDGVGRVIESKRVGGAVGLIRLTGAHGTLLLENLQPWGEAPQNAFLLRERDRPDYVVFLAMLDGEQTEFDARWRGFAYDLSVSGK